MITPTNDDVFLAGFTLSWTPGTLGFSQYFPAIYRRRSIKVLYERGTSGAEPSVKPVPRRVARIWKKEGGGAFLKEWEKCKQPWPKFSLFLNQNHTVCPKIEREFFGNLGNWNIFSAQNQVVSKKKKKVFTEIETVFWPKSEIQTFFPPKIRWSPNTKNKKRSSPKLRLIFGQSRKFKYFFRPNHDMYFTTSAPNFLWGGCFQFFTKNRP